MKVHHLDCVSQCPLSARLSNGEGPWLSRGRLVTHGLLLETRAGLVFLRELAADHGDEVQVFCAHDPHEFDALKAQRSST